MCVIYGWDKECEAINECIIQMGVNNLPKKQYSVSIKYSIIYNYVDNKSICLFLPRYNYICVIYGWDKECEATQEWIIQMGVNNLPKKKYQPFYNVLVEDGSNRYAAQGQSEFFSPSVFTLEV